MFDLRQAALCLSRDVLSAWMNDEHIWLQKKIEFPCFSGGQNRSSQDILIENQAFTLENRHISRVITNSREAKKGDLFIALKGERVDAHEFVRDALASGAEGAVVSKTFAHQHPEFAGRLIAVENTKWALGQLAAAWRRQCSLPVIALTGSNGKTTVKEMLATIFRDQLGEDAVLATRGNLNNEIGVPLMLLELRAHHKLAILELGMNHFGEIAYLSNLVYPDIALINNASRAHLGHFASVQEIAQAKGEIIFGLNHSGVLVLNGDDKHLETWEAIAQTFKIGRQFSFGEHSPYLSTDHVHLDASHSEFELTIESGLIQNVLSSFAYKHHVAHDHGEGLTHRARVNLNLLGAHMIANARAAALTAAILGVNGVDIAQSLSKLKPYAGRLERKQLGDVCVIDDTYNANPDSVRAAIDVLAKATGRRVLVLGDIGELGVFSLVAHGELGAYAQSKGIDVLCTLGEDSERATIQFGDGARHFGDDLPALIAYLSSLNAQTILVKGSRFMKMERVVVGLEQTLCST